MPSAAQCGHPRPLRQSAVDGTAHMTRATRRRPGCCKTAPDAARPSRRHITIVASGSAGGNAVAAVTRLKAERCHAIRGARPGGAAPLGFGHVPRDDRRASASRHTMPVLCRQSRWLRFDSEATISHLLCQHLLFDSHWQVAKCLALIVPAVSVLDVPTVQVADRQSRRSRYRD